MRRAGFGVTREPFFATPELEQIEAGAIRILAEIGIAIHSDAVDAFVRRAGYRFRERRVVFEPAQVRAFIEAERDRNGRRTGPRVLSFDDRPITLGVSQYPQVFIDIATDAVVPATTDRVIEATKLVSGCWDRGVRSGAPATPMDVPYEFGPILQYWISARYSRLGHGPRDPRGVKTMRFIMDMAAAMGDPIRRMPIWPVSPLTLGGDSLECAVAFRDEIEGVGIGTMPSAGCTAPIEIANAYMLAAAESIGSAMIVGEMLTLPVEWDVSLFPADLREVFMIFGSPENLLFHLLSAEVDGFFHGRQWYPAAGNIHSMAKLPGPQATAEKISIMTAGALLGARDFGAAGTLSLDELFSAEQLLYDIEAKDHVERLVRGVDIAPDADTCLADVMAGIRRGFVGLDSTLDTYRELYWHPRLFDRRSLGSWRNAGCPDIRDAAKAEVRRLVDSYDYVLDADRSREVDRVLAAAEVAFGVRSPVPQ